MWLAVIIMPREHHRHEKSHHKHHHHHHRDKTHKHHQKHHHSSRSRSRKRETGTEPEDLTGTWHGQRESRGHREQLRQACNIVGHIPLPIRLTRRSLSLECKLSLVHCSYMASNPFLLFLLNPKTCHKWT